MLRIFASLIFLLIVVIVGSLYSNHLWSNKPEQSPENLTLAINDQMTVSRFGQQNNLPNPVLREIFNLQTPSDRARLVTDFGMTAEQIRTRANQVRVIESESASKNWIKIAIKGCLWIVFLAVVFYFLTRGKINSRNRKWIYASAVAIFGIILGSDPSPMGTVKDAIVLFGSNRAIFIPRMIAFCVFLFMVISANKFICSWGCQVGTLQDMIFRLNRDSSDKKGLFRQIKVPFLVSNSVRLIFFLTLILVAFIWATDIVEPVDPFKIFKPAVLGFWGGGFILLIMIISLFVYRPWCHFFCPFGFVGWIAEKISIFKIKVDYDKCISCQACSKACPSNVMDAILKRNKKTIPDCFACGTCIEVCPAEAISFKKGKRALPPENKFAEKSHKSQEQ